MTDYFSLGSVPIDIDPVQVGSQNYEIEAKKECKKYIKLLKKKFSNIPKNCSFIIKNNPHDFGNYFDVNLKYDNENPEHQKFMLYVDRNIPYDWEEQY